MTRIQLNARFIITVIQIHRSTAGNEQKCRVFNRSFSLCMEYFHRLFPFIELMTEKVCIFFVLNIRLVPSPQGLHGIQRLQFRFFNRISPFNGLTVFIFRYFFYRYIHHNGIANIVGVFFN